MKLPLMNFFTGEHHRGAENHSTVSPSDIQAILRYSAERMASPAQAELSLRRQYPQGQVEQPYQTPTGRTESVLPKDAQVNEAVHTLQEAAKKGIHAVLTAADVLTDQVSDASESQVTTQDQIRERISQIHEKTIGQRP